MFELIAVLVGLLVGLVGSRIGRRFRGEPSRPSASLASLGRSMGGAVGQRRQLSLPHLQRSVFSELIRQVVPGPDGRLEVPPRFLVLLHPDDANRVAEAERWFTGDLVKALQTAATGQGWRIEGVPVIDVLADVHRRPGVPRVEPTPLHKAPKPEPGLASLLRIDGSPVVRHPLRGAEVTIGRGTDQDIRIDDARASRNHGTLRLTSQGWIFTDVGSSNGTKINGRPATPHDAVILRDQDQITIGQAQYRYEAKAAPAAERQPGLDAHTRERLTAQYLPPSSRTRGQR